MTKKEFTRSKSMPEPRRPNVPPYPVVVDLVSKIDNFKSEHCRKYEISLSKLAGLECADVVGYVSKEFGEPVFKVTRVVFPNGTFYHVEGEHDIAYIVTDDDYLGTLLEDLEDGS